MSIIDVDFRYVMRKSPEPVFAGNVWLNHTPVLQWRKKRVVVYEGIARTGITEEWTDWQDVRTDEE